MRFGANGVGEVGRGRRGGAQLGWEGAAVDDRYFSRARDSGMVGRLECISVGSGMIQNSRVGSDYKIA